MAADGSETSKPTASFRRDWRDLQADLRRWKRIEWFSAGLLALAIATLPAGLAWFGQG